VKTLNCNFKYFKNIYIIVVPTTKNTRGGHKQIRVNMLSQGTAPYDGPDIQEALPNMEHYLADIRANLLLFEETHEICLGLLDILDSYVKLDMQPYQG